MATKFPTAQELDRRVFFDARVEVDDGYGNVEGDFAEQFEVWAAFRPRGGSEAVQADRLEGRNTFGIYVRSSTQTRQISSDWRVRDKATGNAFAVKIVDTVSDARWVYLEVQTGVAA